MNVRILAGVVILVIGGMMGYVVASFQFNDRLMTITENVGNFVKNQQQINAVYDKAITGMALELKNKVF